MSSRPIPPQLQPWALAQLAPPETGEQPVLQLVTGDASNRRYFRLQSGSRSYIVAEAPPETEKNEAFLAVRDVLAGLGVRVPEVLAADLQRGYLLLEDLGDQVLLPLLNADTVDDHYAQARGILLLMADAQDATKGLPGYDRALLAEELSRFGLWFVEALLEYSAEEEELALTAALSEKLIASALEQPQVLVHRDFHSRNLMPQPDGTLAVIDFQDAVTGPLTYDLASLLRDDYRDLTTDCRATALETFWQGIASRPDQPAAAIELSRSAAVPGDPGLLPAPARQAWALTIAQRTLKALGTFGFQVSKAGRHEYANYALRTWGHARRALASLGWDELIDDLAAFDRL